MSTIHRSIMASTGGGRVARPALGLILALGAAFGSAGCAVPTGGVVARDVLEIKQMVSQQKEDGEASGRKIEYRLDSLDEKVTSRADQMKGQLDELDQVIRAQAKEIEKLRRMMEGSGSASAAPSSFPAPAPVMTPPPAGTPPGDTGGAPAQPGVPTTDTLYTDALKNFNLGRYDQAKAGFEAVLANGVTGDPAIQAQYWLAESCFALNDMVGAHANYKTLIKANPSHSLAWQGLERLAEISAKQGRVDDALKLYGQIIEKNPSYPSIDRVREKAAALQSQSAGAAAPAPAPAPEPAPAPAPPGN